MKALKSHLQIERSRRINNRINPANYTSGLVLALVGLISAALMKWPIQLASAETVAIGWSYTGSLNTPRNSHTATLLTDGKVLVAGGTDGGTAELYDPATGKWNATGSLNVPRWANPATLLPDGKVLIVGGNDGNGGEFVLRSAELYDPKNERWSVSGSLNTPRQGHTATLLKTGKVLVVGGGASLDWLVADTPLDTVELYDPETGTWSFTGNLNTAVTSHTATPLQNGKVLVLATGSAELYDPDTGIWSSVASLGGYIGRSGHTATLLHDGRVLIVGGDRGGPIPPAQLYDPDTGEWRITGHLIHHEARTGHTATLLPDGKVLVAGGWDPGTFPLNSSELYDPDTGTWSFAGDFNTPRTFHTTTLLPDGRPLIEGGLGLPPKDCAVNCYWTELVSAELGNNVTSCSVSISRNVETFDSSGGTGSVSVTAGTECGWTATSGDSWITVTSGSSDSSGSGTVNYSVEPNTSTLSRRGVLTIAARFLIVTQAGLPVRITSASVAGKRLFVFGENFDPGAVILLNGERQITKSDAADPRISLIGKKAGKKIAPGQMVTLRVVNPNGSSSDDFSFTRQ